MGKIVLSENVSLDGVIQDPTGEEGTSRGGWFAGIADTDRQEWAELTLGDALGAEALLLGRRTYEFFATRYPSRSGALEDRINSLPKYIVSATLTDPGWNNSTVLEGEVVAEVSKLKHSINGDIHVYASSQLVHTLIEHNLVDEVRLTVFPFVLGAGNRLFGQTSDNKSLRLTGVRAVGDSLAFLTYHCVRDAE
jgi:dihydrofolate reductase